MDDTGVMEIRVRLFAVMAQQAGVSALSLTLPEGARVQLAVERVRERFPSLRWPPSTMVAVNQEYVDAQVVLRDGDELALIPPVSGGCGRLTPNRGVWRGRQWPTG